MKRILKIMISGIVGLIFSIGLTSVCLADETGHPGYEEINIPAEKEVYLLVNTTKATKKKMVDKVGWRLFGWSVYVNANKVSVTYKKENIFARANRTSNVVQYEYTFKDIVNVKTSVELDSSLKQGISGKTNGISLSLDKTIRGAIGITKTIEQIKQLEYTITVDPYTKVTMSIRGDAKLSNGGAKNYFLGICVSKGNWEYLDIVNEYYDLYEEKLN